MNWRKASPKLKFVGVFSWNFLLYFLAFFFGLFFAKGDLYLFVILYFLIGAMSFFWTNPLILTILPSALAFPFGYALFTSAMYANDTTSRSTASLWSILRSMGKDGFEIVTVVVVAASAGWLVAKFLLHDPRAESARKAKPYFFCLSAVLLLLYFVLLMLNS